MSENRMTYQDACDLLVNEIYAPIFFEKLANDFGIRPSSQEEVSECLALAGKLQQLHEAEQIKQANDRVSLVTAASHGLDAILHNVGIPSPRSPAQVANDEEIKTAAARLAQVPQVRDAALLYQDAMQQLLSKE
jgi:hypothetical protein